jgi:CDP-4-dehydro-6-deoxyglucose reductase, E3
LPQTPARIVSIARHESGVRLISLGIESPFEFRAGQYLYVVHPNGARIPMSIASAPERLPHIELHFRPLAGVAEATLLLQLLDRPETAVTLDGPYGDVHVSGPLAADLTLFAGGSGISQCRSIVEHLRHVGDSRRVQLIWSVTQSAQLYCDAELRGFASWLDYTPLIDSAERPNAAVAWIDEHKPLVAGRVVIAGGPGFVYAVADALDRIGYRDATIESDVFAYAPRPSSRTT